MQATFTIRVCYSLSIPALLVCFRNLIFFSFSFRLSSTSHTTRELDCNLNDTFSKRRHINQIYEDATVKILEAVEQSIYNKQTKKKRKKGRKTSLTIHALKILNI